ncbi:substrate-binding domain-containing protein [Nocardia sp. NPDC127579]|uniref:substrate-binding domain-containing protein n=1 Tax=Nocardia sp. NPDC127579 TaxID=3345402 RepID=UPI003630FC80
METLVGDFPLDTVLALIGIAVPVGAFLWEFAVVGRRRLGYRVQMDTPVTGEITSAFPGVLEQLSPDPATLRDLSVVLVRVENSGASAIEPGDYLLPSPRIGLHLRFPQRRVIGMAVTELSDPVLADSLGSRSGIGVREDTGGHIGVIDLPKVGLDRSQHYKILAILQRSEGNGEYPVPTLVGGIKGGRVTETRSRTGASRVMLALVAFLVLVIGVQFAVTALEPEPVALECAGGRLTLVGSSAFEPVIRAAAQQYGKRCTGAEFTFEFEGTERGLDRVTVQGKQDRELLTISDGAKGAAYPALRHRALAVALFSVIVHREAGVRDLTVAQVRDLYQGRITNWKELGGNDIPVVLVNRLPGSGTRDTFDRRLLDGAQQPPRRHVSCTGIRDLIGRGPEHCDVQVTSDMIEAVRLLPGAIGYSSFAEASRAEVVPVTLGGVAADRDAAIARSYPFWGVEYAYTYGDPPGDTLAAAFLRYLTEQTGQEVLRAFGNAPCADLPDRERCLPDR